MRCSNVLRYVLAEFTLSVSRVCVRGLWQPTTVRTMTVQKVRKVT